MTLDEAIKHCEEVADTPCFTDEEARCYSEHRQLAEWLKELKAYRNKSEIPTSCGDAISREAAIRAIEALQRPIMREESNYYQFKFSGMSEALGAVENLPSVTPQQRTGRWIDDEFGSKCSCCGIYTHLDKFDRPMKFKCCSMCGAKMEVEDAD